MAATAGAGAPAAASGSTPTPSRLAVPRCSASGGGNSANYGATGGGGDGRIAIGLKFGAGQIDCLYTDGAARGATVVDLTTDAAYSNKVNVAGGNGYWPGYTFGGSGTAVLAVAPPPGTLMILRQAAGWATETAEACPRVRGS